MVECLIRPLDLGDDLRTSTNSPQASHRRKVRSPRPAGRLDLGRHPVDVTQVEVGLHGDRPPPIDDQMPPGRRHPQLVRVDVAEDRADDAHPDQRLASAAPSRSVNWRVRGRRRAGLRDRRPRSSAPIASRENSWSTTIDDAPITPARPPSDERWIEQVAGRERQGAAVDRLADRGEQLVRAVGDAAADDDQRRVEEVDDAREHRADPPAGRLEQRDRDRVAERRRPRDVLGGHRPRWSSAVRSRGLRPSRPPPRRPGRAPRRRPAPRGSRCCRSGRRPPDRR